MERHAIVSRALVSVGYEDGARELQVEFRSGHVYSYSGVPRSVYDWLLRVPNKELFVTRQVRGHYPERALGPASALEPSGCDALVQTVRGAGYRLSTRPE